MAAGIRTTLAVLLLSTALANTSSARVVLMGVDGGTWNLIDPAMAAGKLPNFDALRRDGLTGNLETVEPVISPTVWTSIATGRRPESHRITHFYSTRLKIAAPTVWERLARQGLRVGLYDYLMTWPPQRLPNGFAIPGWLRRDASVEPPDVFERAGIGPYVYSMEGVRRPDEFVRNTRLELAEKPQRFVALADAFSLDVGAVNFYSLDATGHRFWAHAFPEDFGHPDDLDSRYQNVVAETLQGVDRAIGIVRKGLDSDDTLIVVSDHGFKAGTRRTVWVTHLEQWLEREGFDPARDHFTPNNGFAFVVIRIHPGPFGKREAISERLQAMLASARNQKGDPVYTVYALDVAERPPDRSRGLVERVMQMAVRAFLWWNGLVFDEPAHGYVIAAHRDGVLRPLWPDGKVELGDQSLGIGELAHPDDFSGDHDPTGIFLAAGPAIAKRKERLDVSVLDIAPLLFYLTGQPVPDDLEGAVPTEAIKPAHLEANPARIVSSDQMPGLERTTERAGDQRDEEITERLRALGYVQ